MGPAFPHSAFESIYIFSSNHSAALAKSKVMTTVDGAVTVHILAGIFEWIIAQSGSPLFKSGDAFKLEAKKCHLRQSNFVNGNVGVGCDDCARSEVDPFPHHVHPEEPLLSLNQLLESPAGRTLGRPVHLSVENVVNMVLQLFPHRVQLLKRGRALDSAQHFTGVG